MGISGMLAGAIRLVLLFALCGSAAAGAEDPVHIVVFPLDPPRDAESLSWLSEGIAFSLSKQLQLPGVRTLDREARFRLVENLDLPPDARLSRGSMIRAAQEAKADLAVIGRYSGTAKDLKIAVRVFHTKELKLGGEMTANGPLSALPQMENELAWLILGHTALQGSSSREDFGKRTRRVPNSALDSYIESFGASGRETRIRLLQKAVDQYGDFPEARFQLGRLHFQKGDCERTRANILPGTETDASRDETEFMLATCSIQQGEPARAVEPLERMLSSARSPAVLNNVAVARLRAGDFEAAGNALAEAKSLAPSDPTIDVNLAIVRHMQGRDALARGILEAAARTHPKNGMIQFLAGYFHKRNGETEKASAALAGAKRLGVNVDAIQSRDPATWAVLHRSWDGQ